MKKFTTSLLFAVLFICALWLGCNKDSKDSPQITVENDTVSFVSTCVGNSDEASVIIKNTGTSDLVINSVTIEGIDNAEYDLTGNCNTITSGLTCSLTVTFSPVKIGRRKASLAIQSNSNNNSDLVIPLDGIGLPQPGLWEGDDVQFYVSADGGNLTSTGSPLDYDAALSITAGGSACGGTITMTRYYTSDISINDLAFSYASSDDSFTGTFSENNICNVSGSIGGSLSYPFSCDFTFNFTSLQATPQASLPDSTKAAKDAAGIDYSQDGKVITRIVTIK